MKKTLVLILPSLIVASAFAQTNTITFTNDSGILYSNAIVVRIESDDVLFRFGHFGDWQYARVKFTNMPAPLQAQFGYDPEKIRKANEERVAEDDAEAKAAQERQIAEVKAAQYDSAS